MPDTAADALLYLLCNLLVFLFSGGAFVTMKYLFTASRRNRTECGSNDFEDLFDLVWE